jgi:8-oxo-dGTP diphosphatase
MGSPYGFQHKAMSLQACKAAGVALIYKSLAEPEPLILLLKRASWLREPGTWGIPGGMRDPKDACLSYTAMRELREETNIVNLGDCAERVILGAYATYVRFARVKHEVVLNEEHTAYVWEPLRNLPAHHHNRKLHPGVLPALRLSERLRAFFT